MPGAHATLEELLHATSHPDSARAHAAIACQVELQARAGADAGAFDAGLRDLHRTAEPGGVFASTSFEAVGRRS